MRNALLVVAFLLTSCVAPELTGDALPDDVQSFVERRGMCDHFRGEIPGPDDAARMEEVELGVSRYCFSTDRELARLKARYANHAGVMAKLGEYEERIEADR